MHFEDPTLLGYLAIAGLALALLGVWFGLRLAAARTSARTTARSRAAVDGEREAEALLRAAGYRIVGRQVTADWHVEVDGELFAVTVRADLLVARQGQQYVAEVKTGSVAPDPFHPPTRRQLLEYALIFGGDRVLLVDVPGRAIHEVVFPAIHH